jgi:hypothetical protein
MERSVKKIFVLVLAVAGVLAFTQSAEAMWFSGESAPDEVLLEQHQYASLSAKIYADLDAWTSRPMLTRRAWLLARLEEAQNPFLSYMVARTAFKHPGYEAYPLALGLKHLLLCVALTEVAQDVLVSRGEWSALRVTLAQFIKQKFSAPANRVTTEFTEVRDEVVSLLCILLASDEAIAALPLPQWILNVTYNHKIGWGIGWADMSPECLILKSDLSGVGGLIAKQRECVARIIANLKATETWEQYFSGEIDSYGSAIPVEHTSGSVRPVGPSSLLVSEASVTHRVDSPAPVEKKHSDDVGSLSEGDRDDDAVVGEFDSAGEMTAVADPYAQALAPVGDAVRGLELPGLAKVLDVGVQGLRPVAAEASEAAIVEKFRGHRIKKAPAAVLPNGVSQRRYDRFFTQQEKKAQAAEAKKALKRQQVKSDIDKREAALAAARARVAAEAKE